MLSSSGFDLSYPFLSFISPRAVATWQHHNSMQMHAAPVCPASRRWNRRATNWCTPGSRRPGDRIWMENHGESPDFGSSWHILMIFAHLLIKHTLICFDDLWWSLICWYDLIQWYRLPLSVSDFVLPLIPRRSRMWHLHLSSLSTSARASNKCKGIHTNKGGNTKIVLCAQFNSCFMLFYFHPCFHSSSVSRSLQMWMKNYDPSRKRAQQMQVIVFLDAAPSKCSIKAECRIRSSNQKIAKQIPKSE